MFNHYVVMDEQDVTDDVLAKLASRPGHYDRGGGIANGDEITGRRQRLVWG